MKARLPKGYGGGPSNMNQMIKQAQKMQEDMAKAQSELEEKEYTASVGGGVVNITMTGKKLVTSLEIDPEVVDPEDVETLNELVMAAVNEVVRKVEDDAAQTMGQYTSGINIPGLF